MAMLEDLRSNDKNKLFTSNMNNTSYSTGFSVLDFANGYISNVKNSKGESYQKMMLGFPMGSLNSVIGTTGTGKTTLAIQMGWNIIRRYDSSLMFIVDCEKLTHMDRVYAITDTFYSSEEKIVLMKEKVTIDDTMDVINSVCNTKEKNGKAAMHKIEDASIDGQPFYVYQPTVFVIDSLPTFNSRDYNVEDLGGNIDQMRAAKDITRFYTNILSKAWKYNLIFFVINHVRPASNTNQYAPPVQGIVMINPQIESLPRGQVAQYLSGTYLRIKTKKSDVYEEDDHGFSGFKTTVSIAKSKTNIVGTSFPLSFHHQRGFDKVYSHFEFAQTVGLVCGRNPYLYFAGVEEYKFKRNDFRNRYIGDVDFRSKIDKVLRPYYQLLLGKPPASEAMLSSTPSSMNIDSIGEMDSVYTPVAVEDATTHPLLTV